MLQSLIFLPQKIEIEENAQTYSVNNIKTAGPDQVLAVAAIDDACCFVDSFVVSATSCQKVKQNSH